MDSIELIRELCKDRKISIAKLERDCGFSNGYIRGLRRGVLPNDRAKIIADYLDVSLEYLTTGNQPTELTSKDEKDIQNILANTEQLLKQEGLMFEGDPATPEAIESILSAMQVGMEMAKKKNKEKYTPKKYKKD